MKKKEIVVEKYYLCHSYHDINQEKYWDLGDVREFENLESAKLYVDADIEQIFKALVDEEPGYFKDYVDVFKTDKRMTTIFTMENENPIYTEKFMFQIWL